MKKPSAILASLLLFTALSFASTSLVHQANTPAKTADKKTETKAEKKEVKKVPVKKTDKKAAKTK